MADIILDYVVEDNLQTVGSASSATRNALKKLGIPSPVIKKVGICMYEGEINMVIHADGGTAKVIIGIDKITIILADKGPGIPDVSLALQEGWSTADAQARGIGFGAGMGLPNMKKNSDNMIIDTTIGVGTTITMEVGM